MNRTGKLHALLATARVANIPSVVSNVWLGVVIGMFFGRISDPVWPVIGCLVLAGVFLYVGGNFLNDWMDRDWDGDHRPERALPRRLFPAGCYLGAAVGSLTAGVGLAAAASLRSGAVAAGIMVCVVVYTLWHKRSAWAVVPMGLCRGLLPVMGFEAFHPYVDGIWPVACGIFCYIAGLSLSARYESAQIQPKRLAAIARGLLLGTAVLMAWGNRGLFLDRWFVVAGVLPYLAWTSVCLRFRRTPVPLLVSSLLAGIPLVDWMVLLPVSLMMATRGNAGGWALAIACFTIPPLAFISALLLQRLAPAT